MDLPRQRRNMEQRAVLHQLLTVAANLRPRRVNELPRMDVEDIEFIVADYRTEQPLGMGLGKYELAIALKRVAAEFADARSPMKACRESFKEVRLRYRATKAWAYGLRSLPQQATILMDPVVDIISLDDRPVAPWNKFARGRHMLCTTGRQAVEAVQHFALGYEEFKSFVANDKICLNLATMRSLRTIFVVFTGHAITELSCRDWPIYFRSWTDKTITLPSGILNENWKALVAEDLLRWKKVWESVSKYSEFKDRPTVSLEFGFLCRDSTGQGPTLATKLRWDLQHEILLEKQRELAYLRHQMDLETRGEMANTGGFGSGTPFKDTML